jgi:hypothetical protein
LAKNGVFNTEKHGLLTIGQLCEQDKGFVIFDFVIDDFTTGGGIYG